MIDLRSSSEVRTVLRQLFGAAAGIPPNTITDGAALFAPPPPADNLNLSSDTVKALIGDAGRALLGQKIARLFDRDLVPPDALLRVRFGPLADLLHPHFNSLAQSAVFLTICEGLGQNPQNVDLTTPITHLDDPGRLAFMMRVRDAVRRQICNTGSFEFTIARGMALMDAKTVEAAMDATIGGLKDAMPTNSCL